MNAHSVIAFQSIELPRASADPPEGSLRAALGLTSTAAGGNVPRTTLSAR